MTFDTLGLLPESLRAVADQGYTDPTPVQARAIPAILSGRDLLAGAQTGTGKTAAFVLPILQSLHAKRGPGPRKVRALVVVPTRELALQVEQSVRTYGAHRPIRSTAIYGGVRMDRQVRALRSGVEIVVATPGRLLDHVRQRTIDLSRVEILVLDEADRMLDMGFIHDIKRILELLPAERQSLLFSATFTPRIRKLAEELLRDPESIDVAPRNSTAAPIRQVVHPVDRGRKRHLLAHLVRTKRVGQVLVFTRTKRGANRLAEQLDKDGISASAIHGNKNQSQRVRALSAFKQGRSQVLVATDIAARGLDIESLPHVVNFELPMVPEDYVHRIGRTGRAGQEGTAISLVSAEEQGLMRDIEKLLKRSIEREVIEGFEPNAAFRPDPIIEAHSARGRGRPDRAQPGRKAQSRAGQGRGAQDRGPRGDRGPRRPFAPSSGDGWVGRRPGDGERAWGDSVDRGGSRVRRHQQQGVRAHQGSRHSEGRITGHGQADSPGRHRGQVQTMPGERLSGGPGGRSGGSGGSGGRSDGSWTHSRKKRRGGSAPSTQGSPKRHRS
ncbi:MAG: DEAD/DEAH box helicase [Chloroflexota bacterium]